MNNTKDAAEKKNFDSLVFASTALRFDWEVTVGHTHYG